MMARGMLAGVGHATYRSVFGIAALGLVTNLLLLIGCLPLVALLVTTDPALSWPALALAAPLCAPALAGAFAVFREHGLSAEGAADGGILRAFASGYRASWRRALAIGAIVTAVVVVALVDVRALAATPIAVLVVPLLLVVAVLAVAAGAIAIVAVGEAPGARLGQVLRAAVYLAVRRWYLTLVSLAALGVQAAAFTAAPALAVGLTAAPVLYLVWANGRHALRPALTDPDTASAL